MLQACLGLSIRASERRISFDHPALPSFLDWVRLEDLRLGAESADLVVRRLGEDVQVEAGRRQGEIQVVVRK